MPDDYWGGDDDALEGEFEEVEGDSEEEIEELEEDVLEGEFEEAEEHLEELTFGDVEEAEEIAEEVEAATGFSIRILSDDESQYIEYEDDEAEDTDSAYFGDYDGNDDIIAHFDFREDAIEYAKGAPFGVLYVVETDEGFDVARDEDYGEAA